MNSHDTIVVGAGPVGLWTAAELARGGGRPLVLDRAVERSPHSKALGIHPHTLEVLAMRGQEQAFLDGGLPVPDWHFGMLATRLDFRDLATPFPFMLAHPQLRTEELLEQQARALGVVIRRGHQVVGLAQDERGVRLRVQGPDGEHELTAEHVVGADGAGSAVRRAAGFDFPGTDSTVFGHLGDVLLAEPPEKPRSWHNEHGALIVAPLPGGRWRVTGTVTDPVAAEPTLAFLRDMARRVAGTDFGMHSPVWLSRFGNATRLVTEYRRGRVFLAGDAAHINFPAGGVGLNVGVQDAMNLGWKLAAVQSGRAGEALLDSYHRERHPVGVALGEHTQAQTALITATTPEGRALRRFVEDLLRSHPGVATGVANLITALDVSYPDGPRLAASREQLRLLREARPVLLTQEPPSPELTALAVRTDLRLHVIGFDHPGTTVLVRPDGHVWAAGDSAEVLAKAMAELPLR
ncbi:2-polyprenyl-6-methoxyphenol hydroxylase-like FAD-dependent oxidoreductase [Crossiella equi]|uniref:2-polyprenyl-6-methoxyphenol hydroxylase-like FAD-dependent oxidoreductase n=1 Tax=Crossiella equi TaxID=130796 RepID=A0ABS5AB33_9PSEU|nr:FAD-dependent oxidoreductase [Crossiella equi]MBP2473791.1 2-polyprenyl-6-methoxyphenol hydroxylase-like FAD-dependent oxidoreductase [Crossiella equi]